MSLSTTSSDPAAATEHSPWRRYLLVFGVTATVATVVAMTAPELSLRAAFRAQQRANPEAVYVFGDSRLVLGLDFDMLGKMWERPVVVQSRGGAGVYDFLVFVESVPAGATVIVAPSVAMFVNARHYDRSGLIWSGAWSLYKHGASWSDLLRLYVNNRYKYRPDGADAKHAMVDRPEPELDNLAHWTGDFALGVGSYKIAWPTFWDGIDMLRARDCDVRLVELPITPQLRAVRNRSWFASFSQDLTVEAKLRDLPLWSVSELPSGPNMMYDADHVNRRGRRWLTESLAFRWPLGLTASPRARGRFDWLMLQAQLARELVARRPRVVFLGDSITRRWGREGARVWHERIARYGAANLGIGGDGVRQLLWRIEHSPLELVAPEVVAVMIGTNDLATHSGDQVAVGVREIVLRLRAKLPHTRVVIFGILPRRPRSLWREAQRANALIRSLADGEHIYYAELSSRFVDEAGNPRRELFPDWVHLSERGYELWADAIDATFRELGISVDAGADGTRKLP